MSDANIEQVRATAQKLAERTKTDPAFKQQITKDSVKTLTAAGLPENVADMTDVAGYIANCLIGSCFVGSCIQTD